MITNNLKFIINVLFLVLITSSYAFSQQKNILGIYKNKFGSTIQLNSDNTFYLIKNEKNLIRTPLDDALDYNKEKSYGTFKVKSNYIVLNSDPEIFKPNIYNVEIGDSSQIKEYNIKKFFLKISPSTSTATNKNDSINLLFEIKPEQDKYINVLLCLASWEGVCKKIRPSQKVKKHDLFWLTIYPKFEQSNYWLYKYDSFETKTLFFQVKQFFQLIPLEHDTKLFLDFDPENFTIKNLHEYVVPIEENKLIYAGEEFYYEKPVGVK